MKKIPASLIKKMQNKTTLQFCTSFVQIRAPHITKEKKSVLKKVSWYMVSDMDGSFFKGGGTIWTLLFKVEIVFPYDLKISTRNLPQGPKKCSERNICSFRIIAEI